ncbi:inactive TPR repeat-containing thioredoxin TTL3-like [Argentina anserina]|uniref:inactive TPR repeat-containing thioredoxin TTL3-like n=1 Tax=Argentina anserina TaxID=57926 RepID=UPI0021764B97|nr:inactive TPR repeat-containing thioredoxin TTL3-like [Potentilla anserina]
MPQTGKSPQELGFDSLTARFRDSVSCSNSNEGSKNKPDSKDLDLGSPVSPLMTRSSVNGVNNNGGGATSSSSSSGSSGSVSSKTQLGRRSDGTPNNHSGELTVSSGASESVRSVTTPPNWRPAHRRSVSAGPPLIYSGKTFTGISGNSSAGGNNTATNSSTSSSSTSGGTVFPSGNICPSGKIAKSGIVCRASNKTDVLGSGCGNYGHGSIVRGNSKSDVGGNLQGEAVTVKRQSGSAADPEEVKKAGNELYRKGHFAEALTMYDRAVSLSPENAAYRSNRAAALTALGRLAEAVRECEEAVRLDPGYGRAHQRLGSLYLRFGLAENASKHFSFPGQRPEQSELQKLKSMEKHLKQCSDARKLGDWKSVLRESEAAIEMGAESSPQLVASKVEALLKLHKLEDAESILSNIPKFEYYPSSCLQTKLYGMLVEAYVLYVRAQVEMAFGRFENAVAAVEKAGVIDYSNVEVTRVSNNVKMVAKARSQGNDLFSSGRFAEACAAYGEGLKYDNSNSVLYCNRAVCWSKLGQWEQSVEDCNQALKIQPHYTKALLRRAVSNAKLERWAEAVRDYEILRRELPGDNEVVESLHQARVALKKFRGEELHYVKSGGEVEEVSSLTKFKAAISSSGVAVIHFKVASNEQCEELSPFINMLCVRYPSVKFFKVDVEESIAIAKAESIRSVPTFKIYKNGEKVKEMVRPSHQFLEDSVRTSF